jgi:adenine specific DNA methylase Mod
MMLPRLFLARNLLRDDGVIFVHIDDNEVHNLRLLMNEIFGEENFVAQIVIQVNKGGRDYLPIAISHEYLLCFQKKDDTEIFELPKDDLVFSYSDSIGGYEPRELRNRNPKFNRGNRPNLFYPFYVNPKSSDKNGFCLVSLEKTSNYYIEVLPLNSEKKDSCWRWGKEKVSKNNTSNIDTTQILAKEKSDGGWNI